MFENIHGKIFTPKTEIMMRSATKKSRSKFVNGDPLYLRKVLYFKGQIKLQVGAEYPNHHFIATVKLEELEEI